MKPLKIIVFSTILFHSLGMFPNSIIFNNIYTVKGNLAFAQEEQNNDSKAEKPKKEEEKSKKEKGEQRIPKKEKMKKGSKKKRAQKKKPRKSNYQNKITSSTQKHFG
jgi:hypothetical protein